MPVDGRHRADRGDTLETVSAAHDLFDPSLGSTALTRRTRAELRLRVHHLRSQVRARNFPTTLSMAPLSLLNQRPPSLALNGADALWEPARTLRPTAPAYEASMREWLCHELCERTTCCTPAAWITRPGDCEPESSDEDWLRSLAQVAPQHGIAVGLYVVITKQGWWQVFTGEHRRWQRLRLR